LSFFVGGSFEIINLTRLGSFRKIGILFYGGYHYDQSYPAAKLLAEKFEGCGFE